MKIVKLRKISDCENPLHPNHITPGFEKEGEFIAPPTVGQSFYVGNGWRTSTVQEILSDNTFRTFNSIYEWHIVS